MLCDGRGAGLYHKVLGLELSRTKGLDTADAYRELGLEYDPRHYERPSYILQYFNIFKVRLMTNNPRKLKALESSGLSVVREPLEISATAESASYLRAKRTKLGHLLSQFGEEVR
jgi:GTP cyclohydrolase II